MYSSNSTKEYYQLISILLKANNGGQRAEDSGRALTTISIGAQHLYAFSDGK